MLSKPLFRRFSAVLAFLVLAVGIPITGYAALPQSEAVASSAGQIKAAAPTKVARKTKTTTPTKLVMKTKTITPTKVIVKTATPSKVITKTKTATPTKNVIPPAAFGKLQPADGAVSQPTTLTLSWTPSTYGAEYFYCIDTTDNDRCDTLWVRTSSVSTYTVVSGLLSRTQYYWQVRAANMAGVVEADGNVWWSFITADS